MTLNTEDVRALAATHYDDRATYDTDLERMFALLVDAAAAYVTVMRAEMTAEYERAADHGRAPVTPLGTTAGMDAVQITVLGLTENLLLLDEARS